MLEVLRPRSFSTPAFCAVKEFTRGNKNYLLRKCFFPCKLQYLILSDTLPMSTGLFDFFFIVIMYLQFGFTGRGDGFYTTFSVN